MKLQDESLRCSPCHSCEGGNLSYGYPGHRSALLHGSNIAVIASRGEHREQACAAIQGVKRRQGRSKEGTTCRILRWIATHSRLCLAARNDGLRLPRTLSFASRLAMMLKRGAMTLMLLTLGFTSAYAAGPEVKETNVHGMKVWSFTQAENSLVGIRLIFPRGDSLEPKSLDGVHGVMQGLLFEGTKKYNQEELRDFLQDHGLQVSVHTDLDTTHVLLMAPTPFLPQLFEAMEQIFVDPLFAEDRLAHVKRLALAGLVRLPESQGYRMSKVFKKLACAGHACEPTHQGTKETIAALTRADLQGQFKRLFNRDGAKVLIGGDLTPERQEKILAKIEQVFPLDTKDPVVPLPQAPGTLTGKIHFVQFDSPQAEIMYYKRGLKIADPQFFPLKIASHIIGGGGLTSRLMKSLRVEKGLTYGIGEGVDNTAHLPLIRGGATAKVEMVTPLVGGLKEVYTQARKEGVSAEELKVAKTAQTNGFSQNFRTLGGTLGILGAFLKDDFPVTYTQTRNDRVEAVTLEQANQALKEFYDPAEMTIIVSGNKAPKGAVVETVSVP
jgi:zinc protease